MSKRRPNPRLAKIHRNYTVEEIASLFGIHRNTVRQWVKQGLPTSDDRRPMLILGRDLVAYLHSRRVRNKRSCKPGEIYCMRCRAPRPPAGEIADYQPMTPTAGNLIGICPACDAMMYRRVNLARLEWAKGKLDVTVAQALPRLDESAPPSVNSDFA
jgi:excisionase family DNA binding protein